MAKRSGNKTVPTGASVKAFIDGIKDDEQRADARVLATLMRRATGWAPRMWGTSIVAFGAYRYKYASGREGEWCVTGFAPRKGNLVVYILPGLQRHKAHLKRLGPVKTGVCCVYIKRLSDVHLPTLTKMVKQAMVDMKKLSPKISA